MSRWISTVRPSGRPFVTSRALRSPVDAGSIPYSAVTHPRPRPAIQRGTDSSTLAVQITRVSPHEISAEPVAVRTNPGRMSTGRSSSAARSWERGISAGLHGGQVEQDGVGLVHVHVLDRAERE